MQCDIHILLGTKTLLSLLLVCRIVITLYKHTRIPLCFDQFIYVHIHSPFLMVHTLDGNSELVAQCVKEYRYFFKNTNQIWDVFRSKTISQIKGFTWKVRTYFWVTIYISTMLAIQISNKDLLYNDNDFSPPNRVGFFFLYFLYESL